jgi:hypothetical protein
VKLFKDKSGLPVATDRHARLLARKIKGKSERGQNTQSVRNDRDVG